MSRAHARDASLRAIERIFAVFENAEAADPVEVRVKLEMCEDHWRRLQKQHFDIIGMDDDANVLAEHEAYFERAEESFVKTKTALRRLAEVKIEVPDAATINNDATVDNLLPVERCKIPTFDGDFSKWQEFRDMFMAMVDARPISNVQKLQYLKNSVKGSAASVLGNWQLSGNNYEAAWQSLSDVYEDDYLIVKTHLDRLFRLPKIRDVYDSLRTTIDTSNEAVRSLQALNVPVDHWDTILVYMLEERLGDNLKEAWDLKRPTAGLPTLKDILAFLSTRARAKANAKTHPAVGAIARESVFDRLSSSHESRVKSRKDEQCPQCSSSHQLFRCPDFLALSVRAREEKVNAWRLCGNCLRSGHRPSQCKGGMCRTCKVPHNSVLCPARSERPRTVASVVCMPSTSAVQSDSDD